MRLELVTWLDHYDGGSDWTSLEEAAAEEMSPLVCQSVGWVLAEDRRILRLVSNLDGKPGEAEHGFGVMNILKSDIVSRKRLG